MQYLGFDVYEKSINPVESSGINACVFMAKDGEETVLIVAPKEGSKTSAVDLGFSGVALGDGKFRAPLNHENAVVLRKLFPFTAPVRGLSRPKSFGLGDRLDLGDGYIIGHTGKHTNM